MELKDISILPLISQRVTSAIAERTPFIFTYTPNEKPFEKELNVNGEKVDLIVYGNFVEMMGPITNNVEEKRGYVGITKRFDHLLLINTQQ
jgi:hypothetical protein